VSGALLRAAPASSGALGGLVLLDGLLLIELVDDVGLLPLEVHPNVVAEVH